jgi:Ser/Thr protein kinase RdoA (MazF antagonist)
VGNKTNNLTAFDPPKKLNFVRHQRFQLSMNQFPVTNSTLSAVHIALFLQEKYSLSKDTSCKLIKSGINDSYLVTDKQDQFVFRIYSFNWRSKTEITEEIKLLNQLKQNGISVSYPISDQENNYIQTLNAPEGERFSVLFSYASGEKLHVISTENHFRIGQLMARLHKVTQNQKLDRVDYTSQVLLVDSLKQLEVFLPEQTEEMQFMRSAQNFLLQEFQQANTLQIRQGIVHLDIWFDNLNITTENEVTLFDFDFCGNGWIALDLAYYIMQLHNIEKYEVEDYQPKVDSFIKGYESITAISDEEKRLFPMLGVSLYFFYLGIQCQRFDNWSNSFLNENYLKRFINGLVKRYYDIYELGDKDNEISN